MAAERSVTVRLKLAHEQYKRALAEAGADTARFSAAAKGAFGAFGNDLKSVGDHMTRTVTLPLLGLGGVAAKVGVDFDETFTRMTTLAGIAGSEVDGLKDKVLALAASTGRGPQELADGLYFASSAGLDTKTSIDLVTQAAKAAAVGLGSTASIVDAVTSALGAYGTANLTSAQAIDQLVAGAKIAKTEAAELAPQLGRLLPTAQALGVGFDQVVASLGYLSTKSGDASLSATQLDGVLRKILVPSEQGRAALDAVGLSAQQLRDTVASGGLPAALEVLRQKFGGNSDALFQLFDDIQAFQGAQLLLADSTGTLGAAFDATKNSAGEAAKAFGTTASTDAFKLRQALAEAKVALIELGAAVAPLLAAIAPIAAAFLGAFGSLPDWLQGGVVGFLALLAAVGPIVSIAGTLAANFKLIASVASKAFDAMAVGAYNAAGALSTVGAAAAGIGLILGGLVMLWADNARQAREAEQRVRSFTDAIRETGDVAKGAESELRKMFEAGKNDRLLRDLITAGVSMDEFAAAVAAGGAQLDALRRRVLIADIANSMPAQVRRELDALGVSADAVAEKIVGGGGVAGAMRVFNGATPSPATQGWVRSLIDLNSGLNTTSSDVAQAAERAGLLDQAFGSAAKAADATATGATGAAGGVSEFAASAEAAEARTRALVDQLGALYESSFGVLDAQVGYADALADVDRAATTSGGSARNLARDQRALEQASKDVTKAQQGLAAAEEALRVARLGPTAREKKDAGLDVRDAQLGLAEAQRAVADAQKRIRDERAKGKDGDVKGATLDLQRAQLQLERAQLRVADATKAQTEVLNSGSETSKKVKDAVDAVTDAQDRLVDAQQRAADAEEKLADPGGGPVADQHRQIRDAIDRTVTAGDNWIRKMVEQRKPAGEIAAAIDLQREALEKLIEKYGDANGKLKTRIDLLLVEKFLTGGIIPTGYGASTADIAAAGAAVRGLPGRAAGGPTQAGVTYLVGEHGPELWTGGAGGYVTPNSKLTSAAGYGSGAATFHATIPVELVLERQVVADALVDLSYAQGGLDIRIRNR